MSLTTRPASALDRECLRQFLGVKNLTKVVANGSSSFHLLLASLDAKEKEHDKEKERDGVLGRGIGLSSWNCGPNSWKKRSGR